MPLYIAMVILSKQGRPYHPGDEIELTKAEAENLGSKVIPKEVADPNKSPQDMNIKELKQMASSAGIDGYSRKSKPQLVAALTGIRSDAGVADSVTPDEVVVEDGTESDSGQ